MVSIRVAKETDIARLRTLYWDFHLYHVKGLSDRLRMPDSTSEEQKETQRLEAGLREILQREDAVIFVAEDEEDEIIGMVETYLREDEVQALTVAHRYGYVQSLFVLAEQRKSGCGRMLMQVAQEWAKERGATEMQVETWEFAAGPLEFYERMGYRTLRRQMVIPLE